jgi:hypothetical protein
VAGRGERECGNECPGPDDAAPKLGVVRCGLTRPVWLLLLSVMSVISHAACRAAAAPRAPRQPTGRRGQPPTADLHCLPKLPQNAPVVMIELVD